MSVFLDKSKKIKNVDVNKALRIVLGKSKVIDFALDLNRKDQLFISGEDSQGVKLGKYTKFTQSENFGETFTYKGVSKQKIQGETYTLFDTGSWYDSFKLIVNKDNFDIIANPVIEDTNVFERFGENIVGLTDKSIVKLTNFIKDNVISEIQKQF